MKTGLFRAVHKKDGVGAMYDNHLFVDSNVLGAPAADCGSPMYEVLIYPSDPTMENEWILTCEHDLQFMPLSPPCQTYSRAGSFR